MKRCAGWLAAAVLAVVAHSIPAWAQSGDTSAKPNPNTPQAFKDWLFKCEAEPKRCFAFQHTSLQETGQRLLGVVVGNLGPEGKQILHLTVPLGIYIPPGVAMKIDQGQQITVPVFTCTPTGCEAMLDLEAPLLSDLERAKAMNVAFLDAVTRRQITVTVSLAGFHAAYASVRRALSLK